ncbi:MAG: VWA domain-containing protein [Vicinamibacteraceae bacterium]
MSPQALVDAAGGGLWAGLAAMLIVGVVAGWREWSRDSARRAWHGPSVVVPRARLRGLVRVILLAAAAGTATASVIGLTGSGSDTPQVIAPESILIALDISRSMDATDVTPSRQAAARAWLARLVERASPQAVGLVLFAGEPLLTCPLTSDLGALRLALDEAGSTQMAIPGGSVLGPAIARSVFAFGERRTRRTLIVVSDGEDTGSGVAEAAAAAKQAGVVVHTVGVGTAQGIAMPVRRPPVGEPTPPNAETRVTKREEKGLRDLAAATGGLYVDGLDDGSLRLLAGRLRAPGAPERPAQTIWWTALLLTAFGCLALERLWPERRTRVVAATVASLLVLLVPAAAGAADGWDAIREGNAALDRGRTREAIEAYRRAAQDTDAAAIAWFNVGVALAKQDDPKNAAMAFARSAAFYKTDPERARAHYNRGIMLERTEELEESARSFIAALRHDPANDDARVNLAIIRARLERERSKEPPPPSPQDDLEKAMQQVPQQSYAFNKGKKQQRPVTAGSDW